MDLKIVGEVIKIFELETDLRSASRTEADFDDLRFRVELIADHECPGKIRARIWRKEFYRLQPTFPQVGDQPQSQTCDELILVEEVAIIDPKFVTTGSWQTALSFVVEKLNERFNIGT